MTDEARASGEGDAELVSLMRRYQAGEVVAFDTLYSRLAPALRRYLLSMARDATWTEDLLQDTFLQIHRSRRTYLPPRPVEAWAFGVARHVFLMGHRTQTRRRHRTHVPLDRVDHPTVPGVEGPVSARRDLEAGLSQLSTTTRKVVLLHHVLGVDFDTIGSRLGMLGHAARLRSSRGLARLRRALTGPGGRDDR